MADGAERTARTLGYLAQRRGEISVELERMTRRRAPALEAVLPGGAGLLERVLEYSRRGKMLRGALVHLGADLFRDDPRVAPEGVAEAAAAMEFFQAGLLIHDDIMDHDEMRRGAPSFHSRYASEAATEGATDAAHLGESLAICAGDICFFEGFAAVAEATSRVGRGGSAVLALCAEELSVVGLAQMRDCRWGGLPLEPTEEEILAMYRGKTARYSFSMPLATGALLAGRPEARAALFEIGELAGLAFQLRDDELGLFGDEAITGKSARSDIGEGKKTLYRARLLARAGAAERGRLAAIYGSARVGEEDAAFVRGLLEGLGIRAEIGTWRAALASRAAELVARLPARDEAARAILAGFVAWSVEREH